jgi:hypothetical protein
LTTGCSSLASYQLTDSVTSTNYPTALYAADAFDSSPRIAPDSVANQLASGNLEANFEYVPRYQPNWTAIQALTVPASGANPETQTCYATSSVACPNVSWSYPTDYLHQMRWQSPPADSYVTSTTYHIPNGDKILVLFESGSVVKIQPNQGTQLDPSYPSAGHPSQYYDGYDDTTSCYGTVSGSSPCTIDVNGDNPGKFWKISNAQ